MPFILLIIGIILIVYNYRTIKRENQTKQEEGSLDISFQSVLQDNKEELDDYKMELGLLRKDIAESLTELQEEIFHIKKDINRLKGNSKIYENKEGLENSYHINENNVETTINHLDSKLEDEKEEIKESSHINDEIDNSMFFDSEINDGVISEINFSEKVDSDKTTSIKKLLSEGLTEEQICHNLSVSKGEVLLVKGLFKK
ncbi:hypothetical protein CLPUN_34790 [Clostridium puniceum]|uniref:Uncharacterized protein n=1 Tax=Clostridium puniceum TaxID=29367 RepID=A0A1S8TBK2_9CLOT|nr:hypothetical protein [Clostridium puniceum]OOM75042.1 hypothetical protein CLPUN_34790 [Clostridium puniceum]